MQKNIQPLETKLAKDGLQPYTVHSAMKALREKITRLKVADLAVDLLPLFELRTFIETWLDGFHDNFSELAKKYQ